MLVSAFLNVKNAKIRIITVLILSVLFLSVTALFYFRKTNFIQQTSALNRITRIVDKDGTNTLQSRLENYKVAIEGIKAKPFLGWGQETYHYTYAQYFNPKLYADATWYDRVHNVILEWLIIGGIFGLLVYLTLWEAVLFQLFRIGSYFYDIPNKVNKVYLKFVDYGVRYRGAIISPPYIVFNTYLLVGMNSQLGEHYYNFLFGKMKVG